MTISILSLSLILSISILSILFASSSALVPKESKKDGSASFTLRFENPSRLIFEADQSIDTEEVTHGRQLSWFGGGQSSVSKSHMKKMKRVTEPCIPISGKTAIMIGQDLNSINNYTSTFYKRHNKPFGLMAYTTLKSSHGELIGLEEKIDYGSGVMDVKEIIRSYPGAAIHLGLYLVNQCDKVVSGEYDGIIENLSAYVSKVNAIFYIRIGYEFDAPVNKYDGTSYALAYQHIVDIFRKNGVRNAAFVWHSSGEKPRSRSNYEDWYPGTNYVDFCAVSIYSQPYSCRKPTACHMEYVEKFSEFCNLYNIPMMIAESAPFGGIVTDEMVNANPRAANRAGYRGATWERWFTPVAIYIRKYNVRIWNYINMNWEAYPMWKDKDNDRDGYWGDSRLEAHPEISARWENEVLKSSHVILSYDDVVGNPQLCEKSNIFEEIQYIDHSASGGFFYRYIFLPFYYLLKIALYMAIAGGACYLGFRCFLKINGSYSRNPSEYEVLG